MSLLMRFVRVFTYIFFISFIGSMSFEIAGLFLIWLLWNMQSRIDQLEASA